MKKPKPMALLVSGALSLVLAVLALVFLVRALGQYNQVRADLRHTAARLEELRTGDPRHQNRFPNAENVEITRRNLEALQSGVEDLLEVFLRDQTDPPTVEPARFPLVLDRTIRALNESALANNVQLTERFAYGFDRYADKLPVRRDVPRLTRQLAYIENACRTLFAKRIRELVTIERQLFEEAPPVGAPAEPGMRRVEAVRVGTLPAGEYRDPSGLYTRERILFTFRTRESQLWDILGAVSRMTPFCVISRLDIQNLGAAGQRIDSEEDPMIAESAPVPAPVEGEGPARARILPHAQRVVAGRAEIVEVRMGLDFFRFQQLETDER